MLSGEFLKAKKWINTRSESYYVCLSVSLKDAAFLYIFLLKIEIDIDH